MEIDPHTTPSRTGRPPNPGQPSATSKRARSPGGDGVHAADRPTKRLSLAVASGDAITIPAHMHMHAAHRQRVANHRHPSEDWVRQADELSINSPVLAGSVAESEVVRKGDGVVGEHSDVDMNLDVDEQVLTEPRPVLPHMHSHSSLFLSEFHEQDAQKYRPSLPQSHSSPATPVPQLSAESKVSNVHAFASPSTSRVDVERYHEAEDLSMGDQPPEAGSPMTFIPSESSDVPLSRFSGGFANNLRRQRFTMGPRNDCEKCRQGIKGHWAHY